MGPGAGWSTLSLTPSHTHTSLHTHTLALTRTQLSPSSPQPCNLPRGAPAGTYHGRSRPAPPAQVARPARIGPRAAWLWVGHGGARAPRAQQAGRGVSEMAAVLRHDSQDVVDGEWAQGLVGVGGPGLEHKGLPELAGSGETQVDVEQVRSVIFHRVQRWARPEAS